MQRYRTAKSAGGGGGKGVLTALGKKRSATHKDKQAKGRALVSHQPGKSTTPRSATELITGVGVPYRFPVDPNGIA